MQEIECDLGRGSHLSALHHEEFDCDLGFVERFEDAIENLLRLPGLESEDVVRVVGNPSVTSLPIAGVGETDILFVFDPVLDLVLPSLRDPETGLEVDVAIHLIALDFYDGIYISVELHYLRHGVMSRTPSFANLEVVQNAGDDFGAIRISLRIAKLSVKVF